MYTHVLIPLALDHKAATQPIIDLAERLLAPDGHITFLHVMEHIPAYVTSQIDPDVLAGVRQDAMASLQAAASGANVSATCEIVTGHAGRGILDFAEKSGAECIVIASHDPGLQDYLLGSTAGRVVRHAHCSVHVMR